MSTAHEGPSEIDVRERGAPRDGVPQVMDRRLFMQLVAFQDEGAFDDEEDAKDQAGPFREALSGTGMGAVLYADVTNPGGLALLTWSEDPADFVTKLRPALTPLLYSGFALRPELAMFGRTYSSGYEQDLEYWLLKRPVETALNEKWPWAVWYPLRRSGAFEKVEPRERGGMMREHGDIGKAYGAADLAHDIRIACHGLDANDNEFVIGLVGKDLHPLSHVVQAMRKTRQTAEFIVQMGPFFVGHAIWRTGG
jgi:chlorite dismutase